MHLTLLVPGLLWPREILHDTLFDLPLPALGTLLGRGNRKPCAGIDTWLADTFGLPLPLPSAPLRLLGDGGDPGDNDWLCLDPVHLRIDERALVVDAPERLALRADEDLALRQALAPILDREIVAPVPGRWYVRVEAGDDIETLDLARAVGRAAAPDLPRGPDGPCWRTRLAEAQTVLHAHPVNRARADSALPAINTLWPWGAGRLPAGVRTSLRTIRTDDAVLKGIARLAGIPVEAVAFDAAGGDALVRIDALAGPAAAYDAMSWRAALAALEDAWFAPALAALRTGARRSVRLVADGDGRAIDIMAGRVGLWRLWRPPLPLWELAP